MASKPSIPKGTRDFSPTEVSKRNYIISIIRLGHLINIIKITYLSKLAYRKGEKQISYRGTEIDVEQYTLN